MRVLAARPAESERGLAYAALGDLFDGVLDEILPELPPPRRRALEVALLVEDAAGDPTDARALGVAVRAPCSCSPRTGSSSRSTTSSGSTPRRRMRSASRCADSLRRSCCSSGRAGSASRSRRRSRTGSTRVDRPYSGRTAQRRRDPSNSPRPSRRAVPRPTLLRLHEVSGGNPFYALELTLALGDDAAVRDPTQPLPVPGATGGARVRPARRLHRRDARGARARVRRCAADAGTPACRRARAGRTRPGARGERDRARTTAPFVSRIPCLPPCSTRGSLYANGSVHGHLADLAEDPLARARHLALSTDRPDAKLAAELERQRMQPWSTARRSRQASSASMPPALTPPERGEDANRRASIAARAHLAAGDVERARVLASEVLARASPGAERAEMLALMAEIESESLGRTLELRREAVLEPGIPLALQARDPASAQPDHPLQRGTRHRRTACAARCRAGRAGGRRRAPRLGVGGAGADSLQRRQAGCLANCRGGV